ncbi:MAG: hypothetical protein HS113_22260 [Verrucomicrobiales bacterium]|nr:hypothetical protein [Verrucomicrobiales bacterium]
MTVLLLLVLAPATAVFLLSKCFFLAPFRAGWLMMAANIVFETLFKRLRWSRERADAVLLAVLVVGWAVATGPWVASGIGLLLGWTWAGALIVDGRWKTAAGFARQHRELWGRVPLPVPQLIVQIRGPILRRDRVFDLGHWPAGTTQEFQVLVLNPSVIVPQLPLRVSVQARSSQVIVEGDVDQSVDCPLPGGLHEARFSLSTPNAGPGGEIEIQVAHGDFAFTRTLVVREVVATEGIRVTGARITRWRHGTEAAFAWRGDHDLYDPATFQSVEGLRLTLGLARRLRFPNTMFLSGRLSLVEEEHREFCQHYGWDRRSHEIPGFVKFLQDEVDLNVEQEWPADTTKPYTTELGNHMYLHYGTHAAAAPGNQWKSHAKMGDGQYDWQQSGARDSFSEQRDNAIHNANLFERLFGTRPVSYAIPSDVYDAHTPAAMEAAGLEVGSDTDASRFTRVFGLPEPHHPPGCQRFVELTRKIPRDPDNAYKVATLKYWLHAAARTGRAFIFLSHHHLLRYEGTACYHCTEELLRYVLEEGAGRYHVGTLTALGRYWRDVLSPRTRRVDVAIDGRCVRVRNRGSQLLAGLPLEVDLGGGRRWLQIVDVPAGGEWSADLTTVVQAGGAKTRL